MTRDLKARGIWVFAEHQNGQINQVTLELLGKGRELAEERDCQLAVVFCGDNISQYTEQLIAYGADLVYLLEDKELTIYNDQQYTTLLVDLINKYKPEIVLIGATIYGRSLAPGIAARLNTGLTADCTALSIDCDRGLLLQTRPAFGGELMATIICPDHQPQMATVRPGVMKALPRDNKRRGRVIRPDFKISTARKARVLEVIEELTIDTSEKLCRAEKIIAVGRGIGGPDKFTMVRSLANKIGAAIGVSRAVVEEGWLEAKYQIGQTGIIVKPKLYIACGISGAIQHQVGMAASDVIIAINQDPTADIFQLADYGIVGDIHVIIPLLLESIK